MIDARRKAYLHAMGIDLWSARYASPESMVDKENAETIEPIESVEVLESVATVLNAAPKVNDLDWPELAEQVAGCEACSRCQSRTQSMLGEGNRQADLMIVAASPDADEDQLGSPFVNKAGNMLTAMLAAIGFQRDQVYLTHLVKCHSASDNLSDESVAACRHYLNRQIALVKPRIVFVMGDVAIQKILNETLMLDQLRANSYRYGSENTQIFASYHPTYLLKHPEEKAKAWQDLQLIHRELNREVDS